jgi:hypothetical protein
MIRRAIPRADLDAAINRKRVELLEAMPNLAEVWRQMDCKGPYSRRPPIGLRLPTGGGGESGRLSIAPGFDRREFLVMHHVTHVELLVQDDASQQSRYVLKLRVDRDSVMLRRYYYARVIQDLELVVSLFQKLGNDAAGLFAELKPTTCVVCGRKLTDPESLGRGLGPECSRYVSLFADVLGHLNRRETK